MATLYESNGSFYVKFKDVDRKWKSKNIGRIRGRRCPKTGRILNNGITRREAEHYRKIYDAQELNRIHDAPIRKIDLTPAAALDEFADSELLRGRRRPLEENTKKSYRIAINYIKLWFVENEIKKLSALKIEQVNNFASDSSELSKKVVGERLRILIRFLNWCDIKGYWLHARELRTVQRVERVKTNARYLSMKDLHRVFDAAPKSHVNAIKFHYYVGARVGEVGFLRWSDYNAEQGTMTFQVCPGMKKKTESTVYLNKHAIEIINKQRKKTGDFMYIFQNTRGGRLSGRNLAEVEKRIFNKLNLDATSHVMRHTFASQLASNGASLSQIKELMRHAYIEDTMIYAYLTESAQKKAVELLPV